MKKALIITASLIVLLGAGGAIYYYFSIQPQTESPAPPPMTPEAQIERITSSLLIRKIEELKDRAVYLQHREEGRRLIELTVGGSPAPDEPEEQENSEETTDAEEESVLE